MSLRRPHRRLTAWLLALCLLFAQTAALAYACELDQRSKPTEIGAPCPLHLDDVDADTFGSGNLCEVHCQTPTFSQVQAGLDVPAAAVALYSVAPRVLEALDLGSPARRPLRKPPRVLLRTSRLLI
jgi:hypothetical protein